MNTFSCFHTLSNLSEKREKTLKVLVLKHHFIFITNIHMTLLRYIP